MSKCERCNGDGVILDPDRDPEAVELVEYGDTLAEAINALWEKVKP